MNKMIVVYKSKTGFTKRYVDWLNEEIPCDMLAFEKASTVNLNDYETIIFASSLHVGKIIELPWFKEVIKNLNGKKLGVLVTGMLPADLPSTQEAMEKNISLEEQKTLPVFYMQGGLAYEKMGFVDKLMMTMLKTALKNTKGEDKSMYEAIAKSIDKTSKDYLKPLLEYIKGE